MVRNEIKLVQLADLAADTKFIGKSSSSSGPMTELTAAEATALLNTFSTSNKGLVPAPTSSSGKYLRDDGVWADVTTGSTYTFSNGLVEIGGNVKLGGSISEEIDLAFWNRKVKFSEDGLIVTEDAVFDTIWRALTPEYDYGIEIYLEYDDYENYTVAYFDDYDFYPGGVKLFVFGMYASAWNNDDIGEPYLDMPITCINAETVTSPSVTLMNYDLRDYHRIIILAVPTNFATHKNVGWAVFDPSILNNGWFSVSQYSADLAALKPNIFGAISRGDMAYIDFYMVDWGGSGTSTLLQSYGLAGKKGLSIGKVIRYDGIRTSAELDDRTLPDIGYVKSLLQNTEAQGIWYARSNGDYGAHAAIWMNPNAATAYSKIIISAGVSGDLGVGDGSGLGSSGQVDIRTPGAYMTMGSSGYIDQQIQLSAARMIFSEYNLSDDDRPFVEFNSTTRAIRLPNINPYNLAQDDWTGSIYYDTMLDEFVGYYGGSKNAWQVIGGSSGGGVTDGDKGDITVTNGGVTWTIDNGVVTYAKIQNVAANSFLANPTGSSGTVQAISTSRIPLFSSSITGTPSNNTFLRGDGQWATVPHGISISGSANEILKYASTDTFTGTKVFVTDSGNLTLGTGTAGTSRSIAADGSESNVGLSLSTKGTGNMILAAGAGDATVSGTNTTIAATTALNLEGDSVTIASDGDIELDGDVIISKLLSNDNALTQVVVYDPATGALKYRAASTLAGEGGGGIELIDGDYGDITVSSSGSVWTIDNGAVTLTKIQSVGANSILATGNSAGQLQVLSAGLDHILRRNGSGALSFGTLQTGNLGNNVVTYAKIQQVAANSFLANPTGSAANVQAIALNRIPLFSSEITGTASNTTFLRGDGTWAEPPSGSGGGGISDGDKGDITVSGGGSTWSLKNGVVEFANMQNLPAVSVIGRGSNSVGVAEALVAGLSGHVLRRSGTTVGFGTIGTASFQNQSVTYSILQNVAPNSFLANVTGSSTSVQEIATNRIPLFSSAITGTPSASTYLRGDGSWATIPSGGGGGNFELAGFSISNYTTQRTLDGSNPTINDILNVLCTLIADLQSITSGDFDLSGYTISNYTTLRTLDGSNPTIDDIMDLLCTLISDLQAI